MTRSANYAVRTAGALAVAAVAFLFGSQPVVSWLHAPPSRTLDTPPGAPEEALRIGGHWVIEVRNPDGTLASRREFDNDLVEHAGHHIGRVLSDSVDIQYWQVGLASSGTGACGTQGAPAQCFVLSLSDVGNNPGYFPGLVVTPSDPGGTGGTLTLQGSLTAGSGQPITTVGTAFGGGWNTPGQWTGPFTSKAITPIPLEAGQIIQVTVTLTFS